MESREEFRERLRIESMKDFLFRRTFFCMGYQYNDAPKVIDKIKVGDLVELVHDRENSHNIFAVKIMYGDYHLGFIPDEYCSELYNLLEAQKTICGRIEKKNLRSKEKHKILSIILYDKPE